VVGWHSYGAFRPLHALRRAIEIAKPDLLVPCDERAVRHLHELYAITPSEKIRTLIERSLGDADSFGITAARHDLLTLAGAHGARVARSMALRSLGDLRVWGEQQPFPWVLKADGSWAGFGVRIVRTLEDAETAYRQMIRPASLRLAMREAVLEHDLFWIAPWLRAAEPAMSVQAYVDGWPANCAVACWEGEVLAIISAESVTTASQTGPSTVARIIDNQEMRDAARRVVRALRCSGLVGFDFMLEASTGAAHMIEMNPRVTPISTVRLGPGSDLVEALLARLSGRGVSDRTPVTERDLIVYFPHTWQHDPSNTFLQTGYHDVPWEEPALVRALMRPELRDRYWIMRMLRQLWLARRDRMDRRGTKGGAV